MSEDQSDRSERRSAKNARRVIQAVMDIVWTLTIECNCKIILLKIILKHFHFNFEYNTVVCYNKARYNKGIFPIFGRKKFSLL